MARKDFRNRQPDEVWIEGEAARRILCSASTASVRNQAQQRGRFPWRKAENGRIEYLLSGVVAYAVRTGAMTPVAARDYLDAADEQLPVAA